MGVISTLSFSSLCLTLSLLSVFSQMTSPYLYLSLCFCFFPLILFFLFFYILRPARSIMHPLMGSLPLPAATLLTCPVNIHSRCACVCKSVEEACRPVFTLLASVSVASLLSYLFYLICPSVRLSNRLSLSVFCGVLSRPRRALQVE